MTFNISDHIKKFKKRQQQIEPDINIILHELNKHIPSISRENIKLQNSNIFIKNISPTKKTFLKLKKRLIIKNLLHKDISVRDII